MSRLMPSVATSLTSGATCWISPGEGTGGVVDVELFAVEAEQEDQSREDGKQGCVADLGDAPAADDEEDEAPKTSAEALAIINHCSGRHQGLVLHVLGGEDKDEDHDGAECGVGPEQPVGQAVAANAVEVVAGEDGERRDGGQDVAGELGAGEGEEDDGEERPEDEELGEGVARAGVAEIALGLVADLPLGDGDVDGVDQGADGDDRPGHEADEQDDEVVVEGLMVLVAVGGEAFEIVLEEEEAEEGGVAAAGRRCTRAAPWRDRG